jgi:hypothetical protein
MGQSFEVDCNQDFPKNKTCFGIVSTQVQTCPARDIMVRTGVRFHVQAELEANRNFCRSGSGTYGRFRRKFILTPRKLLN